MAGKWRPSTGSSIPLLNQDLSILAMIQTTICLNIVNSYSLFSFLFQHAFWRTKYYFLFNFRSRLWWNTGWLNLLEVKKAKSLFTKFSLSTNYFDRVLITLYLWCLFWFLLLINMVLIVAVLCRQVLLLCVNCEFVCYFRTVSKLYPHYWSVPASGKAEPSYALQSCKKFFLQLFRQTSSCVTVCRCIRLIF